MTSCLEQKSCLRKCAHWPGIFEAGLHCLYTGFFVIEAVTFGITLEQKFHGVLQILLINFYLVLLCLVFIRWNMDMDSVLCHLLISILSFALTLFVGKLILMYIDYMERPRSPSTAFRPVNSNVSSTVNVHGNSERQEENEQTDVPDRNGAESFPQKVSIDAIMKLDPLIVILDISVYLLISVSYIIMLLKISFKLRSHSKHSLQNTLNTRAVPSFYEISSSESSIVSTSNVSNNVHMA